MELAIFIRGAVTPYSHTFASTCHMCGEDAMHFDMLLYIMTILMHRSVNIRC